MVEEAVVGYVRETQLTWGASAAVAKSSVPSCIGVHGPGRKRKLHQVTSTSEVLASKQLAGMQYRPHNGVAENKSAKYLFHAEGIDPKKDRDLPWVAETYELRDKTWTVQHMNHPGNPEGTITSAYRDYGRFGYYLTAVIPDGETRTLRYRIRITPGEAPTREALAAEYEKFVP
jgi:hypothetical protein